MLARPLKSVIHAIEPQKRKIYKYWQTIPDWYGSN